MTSKQQIKDRIKEIGPDVMMLGAKKEIKHLAEMMIENETLLYLTSGAFDGNTWLVVLTNHRVIFLNAGLIYGCESFEVSLNQINSIKPKTGWFFGEICITDGGAGYTIKNILNKKVNRFVKEVNLARHPNNEAALNKCLLELSTIDAQFISNEVTAIEKEEKRRLAVKRAMASH